MTAYDSQSTDDQAREVPLRLELVDAGIPVSRIPSKETAEKGDVS